MNTETATTPQPPGDLPGSPAVTPLDLETGETSLTPSPTPAETARHNLHLARQAPRCAYIKPDGTRCGSPALRAHDCCFYHDRYLAEHGVRALPPIDDANSLQCALQEVLGDIYAGNLGHRTASLLLYGLSIAAVNLPRLRPPAPADLVTDVPDGAPGSRKPIRTCEDMRETFKYVPEELIEARIEAIRQIRRGS